MQANPQHREEEVRANRRTVLEASQLLLAEELRNWKVEEAPCPYHHYCSRRSRLAIVGQESVGVVVGKQKVDKRHNCKKAEAAAS